MTEENKSFYIVIIVTLLYILIETITADTIERKVSIKIVITRVVFGYLHFTNRKLHREN